MKKTLIIIGLLIATSLPISVLAANPINWVPGVTIPGSQFQAGQPVTIKSDTTTICDYIIAYYKYGMATIAIIAIMAIAIGGLLWALSAGNSSKVGEAKGWVKDALLGVGLLLFAFLILATISKDLVICAASPVPGLGNVNIPATNPNHTPRCHFETKNKNQSPVCDNGYIKDANESNCRYADGTANGDYNDDPKDDLTTACCCPSFFRMNNAAFCDSKEEGDACMTSGSWGYCEIQPNDNKVCRTCKNIRTTDVTKDNINDTPEEERCYRNGESWECKSALDWCGNEANGGKCQMEYVYKNPLSTAPAFGLLATGQIVEYAANKNAEWLIKSLGSTVLSCWGNDNVIAACYCR